MLQYVWNGTMRNLLDSEQTILILGKPGTDKNTVAREITRVISDEMDKRVIIVDAFDEITGDRDVTHSGIG